MDRLKRFLTMVVGQWTPGKEHEDVLRRKLEQERRVAELERRRRILQDGVDAARRTNA